MCLKIFLICSRKYKSKKVFITFMDPHTHFLFPFAIALILNKLGIISFKLALLCGIFAVLIDIDHYVEYILHAKKNRFSLIATWNNSMRYHRFIGRSFIHHWQGFCILSLVFVALSFFDWKLAFILAIGYYSHILLDHIALRKEGFIKSKVGKVFVKESESEFVLDIILLITIVSIFLMPLFV